MNEKTPYLESTHNPHSIYDEIQSLQAKIAYVYEYLEIWVSDNIRKSSRNDWPISEIVEEANNRFKKIDQLRNILVVLNQEWESLIEDSDLSTGEWARNDKEKTEFVVRLTEGMIRNSLLAITPAIKGGLLRHGDKITVVLPDGDSFETQIMEAGNRLQERGAIRSLYSKHSAKTGDKVTFTKIGENKWQVKLESHINLNDFLGLNS